MGTGTRARAIVAALWVSGAAAGCVERPAAVVPPRTEVRASEAPDDVPDARTPDDAGVPIDARQPSDATARPRGGRTRRAVARESTGLFDPAEDDALLRRLREEDIIAVEKGRGGRSLAFRVTLESGARAYFKPEQTFSGMHWYAEIAAFHLDRALDLRRTAPSTGRVVPWALLEPAARGDSRIDEIVVQEDGTVRGALVAWIDERLVPLDPPEGWTASLRIDAWGGPSPYVAQRELRDAGTRDAAMSDAGALDAGTARLDGSALDAGPGDDGGAGPGLEGWNAEERAAELSDLVVFDFLTHNGDRWGGHYTNVRTRGVGGALIYLDNAAGFSRRRARLSALDQRLEHVERFRAQTLRRLERLDVEQYAERLSTDPLAPILDERQLAHLEERRLAAIERIERSIERHGRQSALPW